MKSVEKNAKELMTMLDVIKLQMEKKNKNQKSTVIQHVQMLSNPQPKPINQKSCTLEVPQSKGSGFDGRPSSKVLEFSNYTHTRNFFNRRNSSKRDTACFSDPQYAATETRRTKAQLRREKNRSALTNLEKDHDDGTDTEYASLTAAKSLGTTKNTKDLRVTRILKRLGI